MLANKILMLLVVGLVCRSVAGAATFQGEVTARYEVTEFLDGTYTVVDKPGPVRFVLATDYSQIDWDILFNVELLMAGGPSQSFETRFAAQGTITTDGPSPLTFPNANGTASAGTYLFNGGTAQWTLSERIVSFQNVHDSGPQTITPQNNGTKNNGLQVLNYPTSVTLLTSMYNEFFRLGKLDLGPNHWIEPIIWWPQGSIWNSEPFLTEVLPGDFNSSSSVDAADYVTWRNGSGILSPLMTSYPAWQANYGSQVAMASGAAVPEPNSVLLLMSAIAVGGVSLDRRMWRRC